MSEAVGSIDSPVLPGPPTAVRERFQRLSWQRDDLRRQADANRQKLARLVDYLATADKTTEALEVLSQRLFKDLLGVVEAKITIALQEILEQPIHLKAFADFKRGTATVDFWIERDGKREDVYRGQGGSVANILSVGLRLFALTALDPARHRRLLILDEQDCWLRPDLVPKLAKIVQEAGRALGFQVLMISHHDVSTFEQFADKIYRFVPGPNGVEVVERNKPVDDADAEA